jgi:hypothetical protein
LATIRRDVEQSFRGEIEKKKMTEFGADTNMCLVAALLLPMSAQQQEWVRRGGNASEEFKKAMGLEVDDELSRGASMEEAGVFLRYIVKENEKIGVKLKYSFRCVTGRRGKTNKERWWKPEDLLKTVVKRDGKYLIIGEAKKTGVKLVAAKKRIQSVKGEQAKLDKYCVVAKGMCRGNHAISVKTEGEKCRLYDNACVKGSVEFSIENLANKMSDLNACYYFDLYEDKI